MMFLPLSNDLLKKITKNKKKAPKKKSEKINERTKTPGEAGPSSQGQKKRIHLKATNEMLDVFGRSVSEGDLRHAHLHPHFFAASSSRGKQTKQPLKSTKEASIQDIDSYSAQLSSRLSVSLEKCNCNDVQLRSLGKALPGISSESHPSYDFYRVGRWDQPDLITSVPLDDKNSPKLKTKTFTIRYGAPQRSPHARKCKVVERVHAVKSDPLLPN